jgi:hypothetical protein
VGAKTPYALLSFVVGNRNLQERNEYHGFVFKILIQLLFEKQIKSKRKKKIFRQEF